MPHAYSIRIDILTIRVQLRANGRILAKLCFSIATHNVSDAALRAFFRLQINNFCNSVNHKLKYSIFHYDIIQIKGIIKFIRV